jgi:hypothetical protein
MKLTVPTAAAFEDIALSGLHNLKKVNPDVFVYFVEKKNILTSSWEVVRANCIEVSLLSMDNLIHPIKGCKFL